MSKPTLRKAMDTLEFLSQDAETRRLYEMRQKFLHDEASMLAGAREEGEAAGEHKKAIEVAKKLLARGADITSIADISSLSEEEIERLNTRLTN
ncbi:hypothetical protein [Paenibacillus sp. FSL H7-0331]|uniref:hypothetical protein n=1 Tax=Paenibacillus sp. FSL H7-0331 TaxID=1920421 RepID=UPI0009700AC9|nr:hypothetical protein [Paenibacillus sp. FSL H7-0331]OMF07396.1 hypothetical protein BK127_29185 [Paenibacillus sp. FSL H7-0331]